MKKGVFLLLAVLALSAFAAGQKPQPTPKQTPQTPRPFFVPRLIITDVKVKQDGWFFIFTIAYKNVGTGAVPKASELAVKPDFRILIDGREINKGFLYIPETAAGPGWENPNFLAGRVRVPSPGNFDYAWFLGNMVTVKINENLAVGPTSDSQTSNLRPIALNCSYDIMIADASLDFNKGKLTITVRVSGTTGNVTKFQLWNHVTNFNGWHDIIPGRLLYTITEDMSQVQSWNVTSYPVDLYLLPQHSDKGVDAKDIDHRNNIYNRTFHR
jgi:hypothetical protein